jgi:hypothetical protein
MMLADEHIPSEGPSDEPADAALARFLSNSSAAAMAAGYLRESAEVAVSFTELAGDWRFYSDAGKPTLQRGMAKDPDFALRLAPGALKSICALTNADIGELGIAFLERVDSHEPDFRIQVQLRSGLVKLTQRGWLTVLARGGPKVAGWLARKGLRGSSAVVAAIARLKRAL